MGSLLLVTTAIAHSLVARLDDDIEARAQATAQLVRLGDWAWPAVADSTDPEIVAARKAIARARVRIVIEGTQDAFRVSFRNGSLEPLVLRSAGLQWEVWLLEVYRNPPKLNKVVYGGGDNRTGQGCLLRETDFRTLASGEGWTQTIDSRKSRGLKYAPELLEKYPDLSLHRVGFPGRYRFVVTYGYDAAAYKSLCKRGCPDHDDAEKIWNRCDGAPKRAEFEFEIKE